MDDPLSLLMQGIWLLAAGMYPLGMGFLFGVCSACCQECEGGRCQFNEFQGFECRAIPFFPNIAKTVSIDTVNVSDVATGDGNFITIGNASVSISGERNGGPYTITNIVYQYIMTSTAEGGCNTDTECQHFIQFIAIPDNASSVTRFETEPMLLFTSGECAPLDIDHDFNGVEWTLKFGNSDSIWGNMRTYLETLLPNVLMSYDACECGACCSPGGEGCTDDVVEHLCDEDNGFVWAGVGTACDDDPNPCAEE
jgi:hypothetical protein